MQKRPVTALLFIPIIPSCPFLPVGKLVIYPQISFGKYGLIPNTGTRIQKFWSQRVLQNSAKPATCSAAPKAHSTISFSRSTICSPFRVGCVANVLCTLKVELE